VTHASKHAWLAAAFAVLGASAALADSPLIEAVRGGDRDAALALLEAGADANAAEANGTTALHYAAHHGDAALVARLLEAGADPARANEFGSSAMREAAGLGDAEVIALLLDAGLDADVPNPEGQTPLMAVARTGRLDAARLLIEAGADVDAQETWGGQTALMWAAAQSQLEMVRLLIDAGADPNVQAFPRDWERRVTSEPRIKEMFSGGLTALIYAAREGCVDCVHALVEGGADPDLADPDGVTPLIAALLNFRYDTAAALVEAGADLDKWDWWGRTPLYAAVDMIRVPDSARVALPSFDAATGPEIVALLLERGADPNLALKLTPPPRNIVFDRGADDQALTTGATPLLRAAYGGEVEATRLLLSHGALADIPNMNGVTPLLAAAGRSGTRGPTKTEAAVIETLRLLIAAGADVDQRDRAGQSALHRVARLGWNDVVRFLGTEGGADLLAADRSGLTPLDYAQGREGTIAFGRFDPGVERPETAAVLEELLARRTAAAEGG
jgi:ankyrin repeat protein